VFKLQEDESFNFWGRGKKNRYLLRALCETQKFIAWQNYRVH